MLSYQGKVVSVDRQDKMDATDQMDAAHDHDHDHNHDDEAHVGGEFDSGDASGGQSEGDLQ
jgi:hypothetical protein